MVGWNHRLSGHEFEQTLGDGEALKQSDMTQQLNDSNY